MKKITDAPAWQALQAHHKTLAGQRMQDWFSADCQRYTRFSLGVNDLLLDYSKNHILPETLKLLADLAHAANLPAKIEALFNGQPINTSENRPVLHTALRDQTATPIVINGENIAIAITQALAQMGEFTKQVRNGSWLGATGKPIRDIVNIGIGGSHLGPMLATHALADFVSPDLHCHFIANIDAADAQAVLALVNPETTLFIVSSKSFTTLETLTNARSIKNWLQQKLGTLNVESHFVAVTANAAKAMEFGIPAGQIFPVWEWVGGRYSVWSAIGLPLALLIGMENFTLPATCLSSWRYWEFGTLIFLLPIARRSCLTVTI
jgi:glucose-6-phosphate isomerase